MSGAYKKFAVAGAGNFGAFIVQQLLKAKDEGSVEKVVVLARSGSKAMFEGVKVITVDYHDKESIKSALAGIEVVISAISALVLNAQLLLAEAAKEAGVQLLVPSEYGGATDGATESFLAVKGAMQTALKAVGPPIAVFYTGVWPDFIFNPYLLLGIAQGNISVGGDGTTPISWTSRTDAARFVVRILTTMSSEKLKNGIFRCEADRKSLLELAKLYEEKTGKKVEIEYIPISVLTERFRANPADYASFVRMTMATGLGLIGEPNSDLFPEWNPAPAVDGLPIAV
ncbi:NAD-P-binding protein [Gloeopeniophorella convolvens]|nr:NAD-P-binding protein [Gloeopeniophorella convolvens]